MTEIKLVAVDLDGTLLNDDKRISPQTVQAIHALRQRRIPFIIASARPPRSVRHIYSELQLDTLQINYNGALIWDEPRKRAVDHRPMAGELAYQIIQFARDLDPQVLVSCEKLDRWHTDRLDNSYTTATGALFMPDEVAPVEQFCQGEITKLLLLGSPSLIQHLRPLVQQRFGTQVNMVSTDAELLQIMASGVSKASSLALLVEQYGITLDDVMAIGDGENDLEMLDECGMGVAVANAAEKLKRAADWVTPSSNSHGVLDALRHFGLAE